MIMKAVRIRYPLREVAVSLFRRVVFFSSNSASNTELMSYFTSDGSKGSSIWKYSRKFKWNSANFIGTVEQPLKARNGKDDTLIASTFLRVKVAPESNSSSRILLKLCGEMAESSLRLKPNDVVYVAGTLEAYKRADKNERPNLYFKLTVRELNCISQHDRGSESQNSEDIRREEGQAGQENYMKRVHLWQVFFSNPYEWWDNRKKKSNPKQPDFKHKDTGEALWLSSIDPPWVKKQLEILDVKMVEKGRNEHFGSDSSISKWLYC